MEDKQVSFHKHNEESLEVLKKIPSINESTKACDIFSLLSDATRLRILWLLCHTEECVTNIALAVQMSMPAVSFHLRYLRQAEIIVNKKIGKETYYTLADNEYALLVHKMIDAIFLMNCNV